MTSKRSALLSSPSMDGDFITYLRLVEPNDAEFVCKLRSDQSLNRHISQSSSDISEQRKWIEDYKARESDGTEFYFVICHQKRDYGVVRMYDFRDNSFSWGSWIILPSRPPGLVTYSAVMIYELGFDFLGFGQAHFDVRIENQKVIDFHLRSGAQPTSRSDIDQYFIFPKQKWAGFREQSKDQIRAHRIFRG